jgi:hypothetical protein
MNTELEVLKKILDGNDKASVRVISSHVGYGTDYIRFICQKLAERDLIKCLGRDWYKITAKGQEKLERRGLIREVFKERGLKIESPFWERIQIPVTHPSKEIVKLKSDSKLSFGVKTEKLKLGKRIEKAASFLGKIKNILRKEKVEGG